MPVYTGILICDKYLAISTNKKARLRGHILFLAEI
jgi:hypothetical protein